MQYITNGFLGYLLYRVWAYFDGHGSRQVIAFPMTNFSSAAIIYWFTIALDLSQILSFFGSLYGGNATGMSRLDLIIMNNRPLTNTDDDEMSPPSLAEGMKLFTVFQVAFILATFQKYYLFKNYIELLQYKKAVAKCKEEYHEMLSEYRLRLVRPGSMRSLHLIMTEGMLFQFWTLFVFYAVSAMIFGSMFESTRLFVGGVYVLFELAIEFFDPSLCWYERR